MANGTVATPRKRIDIIDGIRGLSILLMVVYHFYYDLYEVGLVGYRVLYSTPMVVLQNFFASLFILISGISCRFSRNNAKRGIVMLACGVAVTLVTWGYGALIDAPHMIVRFGILHFMGAAALIYALAGKHLDRLGLWVPIVCIVGAVLTWSLPYRYFTVDHLWVFGIRTRHFVSSDYFPLMPNLFIYLVGTWLGRYVVQGRFPNWFYETRCRFLAWIGRKTLWVYLIHQPICTGIVWLIVKATNP